MTVLFFLHIYADMVALVVVDVVSYLLLPVTGMAEAVGEAEPVMRCSAMAVRMSCCAPRRLRCFSSARCTNTSPPHESWGRDHAFGQDRDSSSISSPLRLPLSMTLSTLRTAGASQSCPSTWYAPFDARQR